MERVEPAQPVGAAVAADRSAFGLRRRVATAMYLAAEGLAVPTCLTHFLHPCPQPTVKQFDESSRANKKGKSTDHGGRLRYLQV